MYPSAELMCRIRLASGPLQITYCNQQTAGSRQQGCNVCVRIPTVQFVDEIWHGVNAVLLNSHVDDVERRTVAMSVRHRGSVEGFRLIR